MPDPVIPNSDFLDGFIVLARDTETIPAITLGLDKSVNGKPCHYKWKEALPVGSVPRLDGQKEDITAERLQGMAKSLKLYIQRGNAVPLPTSHDVANARNLGWVKDARINAKGNLELLHQFVGDAEHDEAMNKKSSIFFRKRAKDAQDNEYTDLIDHNCITAVPMIGDLQDYQNAIAASRDFRATAVLIPELETPMPLSADLLARINKVPGVTVKADATEADAFNTLILAATPKADTVALSRTEHDGLKADVVRLTSELATAKAETVALARPTTLDPELVHDRSLRVDDAINHLNTCDPMKVKIKSVLIGPESARDVVMLSRTGTSDLRAMQIVKLFEEYTPGPTLGPDARVNAVALARNAARSRESAANPQNEGRTEGQKWQEEQLRARGLAAAK